MVFDHTPGFAHLGGSLELVSCWEFPGGLALRVPGFHCHGLGSIPSQGTEILKIMLISQEKKKKKRKKTKKVGSCKGPWTWGITLFSGALESA